MKFFKNKNTSIRSSQGYSDVAAPGAGGSDPAEDSNRLNRAPERAHEIPGLLPVVYNSL